MVLHTIPGERNAQFARKKDSKFTFQSQLHKLSERHGLQKRVKQADVSFPFFFSSFLHLFLSRLSLLEALDKVSALIQSYRRRSHLGFCFFHFLFNFFPIIGMGTYINYGSFNLRGFLFFFFWERGEGDFRYCGMSFLSLLYLVDSSCLCHY